jgi:electron transfer flavoprotein alpha subunit
VIAEGASAAAGASGHCPEAPLKALEALVREHRPDLLLFPADRAGRELAVRLSARAGIPCSLDVPDLAPDGDRLLLFREIYNGNLEAVFPCETPHILTLRLSGFEPAAPFADPEIVRVRAEAGGDAPCVCRNVLVEAVEPEKGLEDAGLVVVCGAGFASESAMEQANALAGALGGVVAGTRPVGIDGRVPPSRIVGISGTQIQPRLCLVLGASGARAFAVGIYGSACIVGVNTDAQAPLFKSCDAAAVCDAGEFARALTDIVSSKGKRGGADARDPRRMSQG